MAVKHPHYQSPLKFIIVAIVIMVLMDHFFGGVTKPLAPVPSPLPVPEKVERPVIRDTAAGFNLKSLLPVPAPELPAWKKYAVKTDAPPGVPEIVIIIDDLGIDRAHTKDIIDLPGPLTLSFMSYALDAQDQAEAGRKAGDEIMMHMPMEPLKADEDSGGDYFLRLEMTPEELGKILTDNLKEFGGYVGINNHMGSRLTQDRPAMEVVMKELKKDGLLFVDSKTIATTIAEKVAAENGVPHAARDVFLDDINTVEAVNKQLADTERIARKRGYAIAIGHPRKATIEALKAWLPGLKGRGFVLVPVSAVVKDSSAPSPPP